MNKKVRTVLNDKNLNEASKILKLHVSNENQMTQLARILAPLLPQTGVLLINGIMGSGKTFLCRNFIQAKQENEKKYVEDIPSPHLHLSRPIALKILSYGIVIFTGLRLPVSYLNLA